MTSEAIGFTSAARGRRGRLARSGSRRVRSRPGLSERQQARGSRRQAGRRTGRGTARHAGTAARHPAVARGALRPSRAACRGPVPARLPGQPGGRRLVYHRGDARRARAAGDRRRRRARPGRRRGNGQAARCAGRPGDHRRTAGTARRLAQRPGSPCRPRAHRLGGRRLLRSAEPGADLGTGRASAAGAGPRLAGDRAAVTRGHPARRGQAGYEAASLELRPGDLLLLYSDGLIERRHRSLDEGLAALPPPPRASPTRRT